MSRELTTAGQTQPQTAKAGALDIGSGLGFLASGFASLAVSRAEARQFKIQSIFEDLRASNEKLKAQENAIMLRKQFFKNISSANASFAARGVSRASGIGRKFTVESLRILNEDLAANELNSRSIQNQIAVNKSQQKFAQESAKNLGLLRAAAPLAKGAGSLLTGFQTIR
jgi:hypothetical protein